MSLVDPVHRYRWIIVINPSYYGLAAIAVLLLSDFESECERDGGSELDCYTSSGDNILANFDFDDTNPYFNIMVSERPKYSYSALVDSHLAIMSTITATILQIMLVMTVLFLVMAAFFNWVRYLQPYRVKKKHQHIIK